MRGQKSNGKNKKVVAKNAGGSVIRMSGESRETTKRKEEENTIQDAADLKRNGETRSTRRRIKPRCADARKRNRETKGMRI